ncbi:MAG TPA: hypothetical protein GX707_11135 [Epulopiscium sp.]|nr:hypothetical protein [Candidatus Epulonipiscium sp.]
MAINTIIIEEFADNKTIKMKQDRELLKKEIISQATSFHFRMIMCKPENYKELYDFFAEDILKMVEND